MLRGLSIALCLALLAPRPAPALVGEEVPSLAPMLTSVTPAVVNIATLARDVPLFRDPAFRRFFRDSSPREFTTPQAPLGRKARTIGSGVIVDAARGLVVTNHHLIAEAGEILVTLKDKRQLEARLLGSDEQTDVAVLEIDGKDLSAIAWGDSDKLEVGDFVLAIGNPFALGQTVTMGIVSALDRTGLGGEGYQDFIQTDASINPGNSGGPLVNLKGELVGINTAIIGTDRGSVGIGFAVPANMARAVVRQFLAYGDVRRGGLGIRTADTDPLLAAERGLPSGLGATIVEVEAGSAAAAAGLKAGDIIVALSGRTVRGASHLRNMLGVIRPGTGITVAFQRAGKRHKVEIVIAETGD